MKARLIFLISLTVTTYILYILDLKDIWRLQMSEGRQFWSFCATACAIFLLQYIIVKIIRVTVKWRGGTEGEGKMLAGLLDVVIWVLIIASLLYSFGKLNAVGVVAAGFAGLLLGWSLQAPVSGIAAWMLVTLKRPFRVGDRVFFPSLNLTGDVKQVGMMYTMLDQVGGTVGSEEAVGRDILIPNAMLFSQVAINYTPKAEAAYFLDEVIVRTTYDSNWDEAEKILLEAARSVTANVIAETGQEPYIRSDMWDYGVLLRLRYMTMAKERPRITHEIVKCIFKSIQSHPNVDIAIPFVYSYRRSTFPGPGPQQNQKVGPIVPPTLQKP